MNIENQNDLYMSVILGGMKKNEIAEGKEVDGQDFGKCLWGGSEGATLEFELLEAEGESAFGAA